MPVLPFALRLKSFEIIPDVYQLSGRGANIYIIIDRGIALIDTGYWGNASFIISFLKDLGRSPRDIAWIFLTHLHSDHGGGLPGLKKYAEGARVAVHRGDIESLPYPFLCPSLVRSFTPLRRLMLIERDKFDILLNGGEVFPFLGGLEVIHTPGHTPGSVCYYSPSRGILFCGDAINLRGGKLHPPPFLSCKDSKLARESIKKLSNLNISIICGGHGKPITQDASLKLKELAERL